MDMPLPNLARTRPDIVFTRVRVAVFVDGCFWHRCPDHETFPKTNAEWWGEKLDKNVRRDRAIDEALTSAGWTVIRIWEHENPVEAADHVEKVVRSRYGGRPHHSRSRQRHPSSGGTDTGEAEAPMGES